jgi:hypothetical protein
MPAEIKEKDLKPRPMDFEEILGRAERSRQAQEQKELRDAESERQQRERRDCLEAVRVLFSDAHEACECMAQDPDNTTLVSHAVERFLLLGRGIQDAELAPILEELPLPGTPDDDAFLSLRFVLALLREGLEGNREGLSLALKELADHPNLRDAHEWLGNLADKFCGYEPAIPGMRGGIAQPVPKRMSERSIEAECALGLRLRDPSNGAADKDLVSPSVKTKQAPVDPELSQRQYDILEALYLLKAFSCDSRVTTAQVAKRAEGPCVNPEAFKEPIADLKHKKLIDTKDGRGGGCWLTDDGRRLIERLRDLSKQ